MTPAFETNESGAGRAASVAVVRRGWPIVVAAAVAAAVVAGLATGGADRYAAKSSVAVSQVSQATSDRIPKPDAVVRQIQADDLEREVSEALGSLGADGSLRVYTVGTPASSIAVEYAASSAPGAQDGAAAAAALVAETAREMAGPELLRARAERDAAESALDRAEAIVGPGRLPSTVSDVRDLMDLRIARAEAQASIAFIEGAYLADDGDPAVTRTSGMTRRLAGAAGGALVGLVAGLLIAAARELIPRGRRSEA